MRPSIRSEFMPMLKIAVPVVLAELGWMTMGVVDTVMVGPLGPEAISAAATSGQNVRVVTVTGANHIYTGQIEELAHKLRAWLAA